MYTFTVATSQGIVSVWTTQSTGRPVFFLHGNSACKEAFKYQFSDFGRQYRLFAMDLPGHGESQNAKDPETAYTIPGYADVALEVIRGLNLDRPVLVGWSLGGHIALSMVEKGLQVAGVLITGTPPIPISTEGFSQGFKLQPRIQELFPKETFTEQEAADFMVGGGFQKNDREIIQAALRTDGKARSTLAASLQNGLGGDQRKLVEQELEPELCIVQGKDDSGINNDYIQSLTLKNGKVHVIEKSGHAVFWQNPKEFNQILALFLSSVI